MPSLTRPLESPTPREHLDGDPPGVLTDEPTSSDRAKPSCLPTSNWQLCSQGVGEVRALTHAHPSGEGWPDDKPPTSNNYLRAMSGPEIMD
ncbi:hypothetical protein PGT21_005079 [Puccinia graminis f. sp. tritici]|uniref:Uncharacterized protein n=1 Tax=Puccinia graminis f. sp. tritici TaxID=56615 RepID=A0A5B0Q273_PUCGR|nr:hypothetical protein PGT21_005079 [Puccinia graminis f. sp. tritici]KAA1137275.1 hypothetical protein PGTUg99_015957 [Puccinia graminis f. sp. tritici]